MNKFLAVEGVTSMELERLLLLREQGEVAFVLVDVREVEEYQLGAIAGVDQLHPTSTFQRWGQSLLEELREQTIIFTCRSGNRSGQIQQRFRRSGHPSVINHIGGILSYKGKVVR